MNHFNDSCDDSNYHVIAKSIAITKIIANAIVLKLKYIYNLNIIICVGPSQDPRRNKISSRYLIFLQLKFKKNKTQTTQHFYFINQKFKPQLKNSKFFF
jgi:hypothetical protein